MCAKHYENPTMLSRVTAKNVGDVFFETHLRQSYFTVILRCTFKLLLTFHGTTSVHGAVRFVCNSLCATYLHRVPEKNWTLCSKTRRRSSYAI